MTVPAALAEIRPADHVSAGVDASFGGTEAATLTFPRTAWITFTSALRLDDLAEL
ncbi:hypothetical protein ACWD4O_45065 [Streptomyces sp. NPDC002623]